MNGLQQLMASALLLASTLIALPASALSVDDFEDGNTVGWLETTIDGGRGANGTYDVQLHNGSNMAHVYHGASGQHALGMDFTYSPTDLVSFDMHAVAVSVVAYFGSTLHAHSGLTMTFLNQINVPLGKTGLYNVTSQSLLPANSFSIDAAQHNYSGTLAYFASLAGLNPADTSIAKVNFSFHAAGAYEFGGNIYPNSASYADVWFDDFAVGAAPEPGTFVLVLAGFAMVTVARWRSSES